MTETNIHTDIAIYGGGIAGLWLLNRLQKQGYQTVLFESNALGAGQTIASQGIIHGGIKYALTGFLSGSANASEKMPDRWKECLQGTGEIDLRKVNILSNSQLLWSTGSLHSEIASFFASKALNSRVQKLVRDQYPPVLQDPIFKGHVYRLEEVVLDVPSLIQALASPYQSHIFKTNPNQAYKFSLQSDNPQHILSCQAQCGMEQLNIHAKRYVFTAGEGNESLASLLSDAPAMQRRPLQMTIVKFDTPYSLFAHCIDNSTDPRMTITTHPCPDGKTVWYLGGKIAENGVNRTAEEQIEVAKKELKTLFPWLDLKDAKWASFFINRAESRQSNGKRPDTISVSMIGNAMIGWPTKLALSPLLADEILRLLQAQSIEPSKKEIPLPSRDSLERPSVAQTPWEKLLS